MPEIREESAEYCLAVSVAPGSSVAGLGGDALGWVRGRAAPGARSEPGRRERKGLEGSQPPAPLGPAPAGAWVCPQLPLGHGLSSGRWASRGTAAPRGCHKPNVRDV